MFSHKSVLLNEVCQQFDGHLIRCFFDGTLGFGGHAEALMTKHPELECYFGVDRDPKALAIAQERLAPFGSKLCPVRGNFADFEKLVATGELFDGMLLDLGVSSMQLDDPEKGFSFRHNGPLDMRMDPAQKLNAAEIIAHFSEKKLADLFWEYGEERRSRKIANVICEARREKRILTTFDLCRVCEKAVGPIRGSFHLHPMTLVFQALRIYVNDELGALQRALQKASGYLVPGARLCIISFHSLEDRIVKNFFREWKQKGEFDLLTKKPLVASSEEIDQNRRSRSAKMRVVEKR